MELNTMLQSPRTRHAFQRLPGWHHNAPSVTGSGDPIGMPAREVLTVVFVGARIGDGSTESPCCAFWVAHPCLSFLFAGLFGVDVLPMDVFEFFTHPHVTGELARHRGGCAVV